MNKVNISIAGHTNTGKTTLIRCLTKKEVGVVEDRANVTTENVSVCHSSLHANFIDTPGLQDSGVTLLLREQIADDTQFKNKLAEKELLTEIEAVDALKEADIVYYVASASIVPDQGFVPELKLIKTLCSKIIGIVNHSNSEYPTNNSVHKRVQQWKEFFMEHDCDCIVYDFHWDSPKKQIDLYRKTIAALESNAKLMFQDGLSRFEKEEKIRFGKLSSALFDAISECETISYEVVAGHDNTRSEYELSEDIKTKITKEVTRILDSFSQTVCSMYSVQPESYLSRDVPLTTKIAEDILKTKFSKTVETTIEGATGGAGLGAFFGVFSGGATLAQASAAGIALSGGLFFVPLAIATGIGLLGGAIAGAKSHQITTKKLEISIDEDGLLEISKILYTIIWSVAYFGFEAKNVSQDKANRISKLLGDDIPSIFEKNQVTKYSFKDKAAQIKILGELGV